MRPRRVNSAAKYVERVWIRLTGWTFHGMRVQSIHENECPSLPKGGLGFTGGSHVVVSPQRELGD
jgi:hypothetical protein